MRKFIQIQVGGSGQRMDGMGLAAALVALADDGTVWVLEISTLGPRWTLLPTCPQPAEAEPQ